MHLLGIRNKRQQIRGAHISPRLAEQRGGLPAVVGLVVEEVDQQSVEIALGLDASGVGLVQRHIQISLAQLGCPLDDCFVEELALRH